MPYAAERGYDTLGGLERCTSGPKPPSGHASCAATGPLEPCPPPASGPARMSPTVRPQPLASQQHSPGAYPKPSSRPPPTHTRHTQRWRRAGRRGEGFHHPTKPKNSRTVTPVSAGTTALLSTPNKPTHRKVPTICPNHPLKYYYCYLSCPTYMRTITYHPSQTSKENYPKKYTASSTIAATSSRIKGASMARSCVRIACPIFR